MRRPWCACGKVRLTKLHDKVTSETARRVWFHAVDRCSCYVVWIPVARRRAK